MRSLTCKHDMGDNKLVLLRPNFIDFHIFNNLENCRPYTMKIQLSTDDFLKKSIEQFLKYYNICWHRPNYTQK